MWDATTICIAALGVLFIGLAKAGFGGALGMLTTPLCVMAFAAVGRSPSFALGVILPLLCAGDLFSLYHYWGKWEKRNLKFLLLGVVIGVCLGSLLVGRFSPRQLNIAIGLIAVLFVAFQVVKERIFAWEGQFQPNHRIGFPFGLATGVTSTFAHGAGPVVSIFLIAQNLPKEIFIGTSVLVFTFVNWIKVPFFIGNGIITLETAKVALCFLPLIPVGVWLGVWANRRMSEVFFQKLAYVLIFFAGVYLLIGFQPGALASSSGAAPVPPTQTGGVAESRAAVQMARGAMVRGDVTQRRLSLVFTGHEYAEGAAAILDALRARGWKASFFLTGAFLDKPEFAPLVQRMLREGHVVGPHSDAHLLYCSWEPGARTLVTREDFRRDLQANARKIAAAATLAGVPDQPRVFLPPYEHYNEEIARWTQEEGFRLVNYTPGTRSHADYTGEGDRNFASAQAILDSIRRYEASNTNGLNGFILLMHTGAGPGRKDVLWPRLPELYDWLEAKGYAVEPLKP
jgi:uncharacterized membrane protein YfcA/peptidoglycan/xylan/chitin deacetylase (PgdA/CDA1 family)